ncbi:VCBS repeat-containing protein [Mucilaginibacter achroorhodeus]|uniref:VCBS repeat-containing protein n=1 Tax=Mucilaginibacter achroorhodeus TaxID=2599294 RepID=A0A563U8N2_9SPHI|nr:VCBS repeat-containing protein [Mucilaginibacter achroorhodeus]TWR27698.1 VCBS repeat-containing protein [Mucilaginibacter achroorhodeus]
MSLKRNSFIVSALLTGLVLLSISAGIEGCKPKTAASYKLTGDVVADGKYLTQQYCTNCHALVPANALTKDVWRMHALPVMADYLKISTYGSDFFKKPTDTGGISLVHWQAIVDYYNKIAPAELKPAQAPVALSSDWAGFTLRKPNEVTDVSFTTTIKGDPATGKIYTSDLVASNLTEWDTEFKPKVLTTLSSGATDIQLQNNGTAVISAVGRIDHVDYPNGRIQGFKLNGGNKTFDIAGDMPRPVQTISADFDKDGKDEIVVCGEGFKKGGVYLLKTDANDKPLKQTTIADRAGAVQAIAQDFNKDGWPDLMVLYGIGNEGLALYLNDQKGGFTTKELLQFPPVNGSTSFQLTDLDHDGNLDLIYTCGYNFHDSRILKPYHGLYIYKNKGDFKFEQQWFYPINGATKAVATDFDGDGDIDIATIAFFADMKEKPAEEFIYFEQQKPMQFKPHSAPVSQYGRWMSMDVTDINKDGKPDILLGNYASGFMFQPNFAPTWNEHLPFIVLQNNFKK